MQCYTVDGRGLESLTLQERPEPRPPAAGEVLVEVHAAALNYRDLLVAGGQYGGAQNPPIVPVSDMSGVVAAVGPGVDSFRPGDRVLNAPMQWPSGPLRRDYAKTFFGGQGVDGVLAEQILVPAEVLVAMPEHLSHEEGATFTVAGLTAWAAIETHGRLQQDEWVLLHGTGGVSIFAVQFAKLRGARVIVSTSNADKARQVRERFGVDETINYRDADWPDQVRTITGGGADIVVEVAGGATLGRSIEAAGYGARIGVIGVLDGLESTINIFHLLMRQIALQGIYMQSITELHAMMQSVARHSLRPAIDRTFPFAKAAVAYEHLKSQQHLGKIVIQVR